MITLPEYTDYWARYRADEVVIVSGDVRITWAQFRRRVRAVAAGLQDAGVEAGDRVGILLTSSAEWVVVFAAVMAAGGVIVPLNPRFGRFELRAIEEDAECKACVSTPPFCGELSDRFDFGNGEEGDIVVASRLEAHRKPARYADLVARGAEPASVAAERDDIVAIFYTSGTTGLPKGAVHTHASIQAGVTSQTLAFGFTSADRALILAPLAFTGACLSMLAPMLMIGACTVIEPAYDPARMIRMIEREKITFITAVPAIWERLPALPGFDQADFSSLRKTMTGGAPVPVSLLEAFRKKGTIIRQTYGSTEAGGMICAPTEAAALSTPASSGRSLLSAKVKVMARDGLAECPPGEVGEIWVRGPQIMAGYWRNPTATAAAFVDGWYKSGDLGSLDETGALTVVDRLKNMIISGGVNIYPAEVERAMASISAVEEIAVFGASDEKWGERVVALIHSSKPIDVDAVKAEARALLGALKAPRDIVVCPTPLPRTVTNKISRQELAGLYARLVEVEDPNAKTSAA